LFNGCVGLKCYGCVPKSFAGRKPGEVDCEEFDKLSDAEKKTKATDDCSKNGKDTASHFKN
jgi:hypothetical protein